MVEVISVEPFTAKSEDGEYRVHALERFEVISGFQILKFKNQFGRILICPEEYLGTKLIEVEEFYKEFFKEGRFDDFIKSEEMRI